jgi:hypothetical protein
MLSLDVSREVASIPVRLVAPIIGTRMGCLLSVVVVHMGVEKMSLGKGLGAIETMMN